LICSRLLCITPDDPVSAWSGIQYTPKEFPGQRPYDLTDKTPQNFRKNLIS